MSAPREVQQYTKKPVTISAVQLTRDNVLEVFAWCGAKEWDDNPAELKIKTLEGVMTASEGDFIIRGVKGEFYPCKPDIFAATYEDAAPPAAPDAAPPVDTLATTAPVWVTPDEMAALQELSKHGWRLLNDVTLTAFNSFVLTRCRVAPEVDRG